MPGVDAMQAMQGMQMMMPGMMPFGMPGGLNVLLFAVGWWCVQQGGTAQWGLRICKSASATVAACSRPACNRPLPNLQAVPSRSVSAETCPTAARNSFALQACKASSLRRHPERHPRRSESSWDYGRPQSFAAWTGTLLLLFT